MPSFAFARFWQVDLTRECFLGYLNQDDMRSMRLVSHDFADTVAPILFKELTINFNATCFTRQARIAALTRIGQFVRTFTFSMPHTEETFLPPLLDPDTLDEVSLIYTPQVHVGRPTTPGESTACRYGSWEMNDLLIRQYPLLFHAATNVSSFTHAMQAMTNVRHVRISCPNHSQGQTSRRDIVDYALISLRIAIEQSNPACLDTLSLDPIHPSATNYLRPQHTIGASPSSTRVWRRIKKLNIIMDSPEHDFAYVESSTDHLKTLHNYLSVFTSLRHFDFTWTGTKGPSPLSLNTEPCTTRPSSLDYSTCLPPLSSSPPSLSSSPSSTRSSVSSFSFTSHRSTTALRPLRFRHLKSMRLCNSVLDATQASTFIHTHRKTLSEFQFEVCHLRTGTWDDALEPLTHISGNDDWRRQQYKHSHNHKHNANSSRSTSPNKDEDLRQISQTHPALRHHHRRPSRPSIQIPTRTSSSISSTSTSTPSSKKSSSSTRFFNEIIPPSIITNEIMDVPLILSPESEIPETEFIKDQMWQPDSLAIFDKLHHDNNSTSFLGGIVGGGGKRKKNVLTLRRLVEKMGIVDVKMSEEDSEVVSPAQRDNRNETGDVDMAMEGVRRLLGYRSGPRLIRW